ncbi:hypothetical protein PYCCODRAFT_1382298 [Trametes coccinea BRFM310]|uniref:Uncharacterized protein n=1 Tax=Trametes coccinea (strain BRFM310) TaxID=1353009 RepID=A0A1Y2J250_TRAC3|nr:hypothetical protein PYCCODRAFT_1382298 [Trametes coccinea BRFM310]
MPGVTKSMPAASSSSSDPLSNAIHNLTRAATVALTTVQEQAQAEATQARAERDDALKALHEAQLEIKESELREQGWRAALEKADMTTRHQAETITQLRNEIDQWKNQLTRLEESSRQEIDDWKEQYRRAEHERTRLSVRVDELIAGQLAWNAAAHAYTPYTPRVAYTEIPEPSTSSFAPKRASTASHAQRTGGTPRRTALPPPDVEEPPLTIARKQRAAAQSQTSRPDAQPDNGSTPRRAGSPVRQAPARRKAQVAAELARTNGTKSAPRTPAGRPSPAHREAQAHSEPRQQIIRRVTAIVDVKEEEEEEALGDDESVRSGSVYEPDEEPPRPPSRRRRRASNATPRRKQIVPEWDEDEQTPDVGEGEERYTLEEDEDEDEDDELLLAPKKKRSDRQQRQSRTGASGKPTNSATAKNLKRKIDVDASSSSGRAGPVKAAKTR